MEQKTDAITQTEENKTAENAPTKREVKAAKEKKAVPTGVKRVWQGITSAAAATMFFHDRVQAACDRFFAACGYSLVAEYHDAQTRYRGTSRRMISTLFLLTVITCGLLLSFETFTVYEYAYNGRILGYVKAQDTVVSLLDIAGDRMSGRNDAKIKFKENKNVTFRKVSSANKDVDDADAVINKLTYMTDIETTAYGIYESGKLLTVVDDAKTAENVMEEMLAYYGKPDKGMKKESLSFANKVEIKPVDVMLTSVQSAADAEKQLSEGGTIEIKHIIKETETVKSIATSYNVKESGMRGAKAGSRLSDLESGDIVIMTKEVKPLSVQLVESGKMSEILPYETEKQETDSLYKGDTQVQQAGEDGRQIITGKVTRVNGKIIKRDLKKKELVKEPVKEIVLVGTKDKPKTTSTGDFDSPIKSAYTINANGRFGLRWGRMHEGLDYSCPTGTPIYAADGGTVTKSGVYGGYGNCLVIRHDNGSETLYGHCSKLNVGVGAKVYKGQVVAAVGNTGRSTGAHLHFEIHIGGKPVNPESYL